MAAALTRNRSKQSGLSPLRLTRDLYEVAELIEIGFAGRLDSQGRAAIREMKTIAQLGPLLWLLALLDQVGLGTEMGYVWREGGRVVGNASLYRGGHHPIKGRGWMVANVTVHPDYRRRGIARSLMEATIEKANRLGGGWMSLQVEANNIGAQRLYTELGFQRYEKLEQWHAGHLYRIPEPEGAPPIIRMRRADEVSKAVDLIFRRARLGGMSWTRPIDRSALYDPPFSALGGLPEGRQKERWVLIDPTHGEQFQAVLWVEAKGWSRARLTLFTDPNYDDLSAVQALLVKALNRSTMTNRSLQLEVEARLDIEEFLRACGLRRTRTLYQMRYYLGRLQ